MCIHLCSQTEGVGIEGEYNYSECGLHDSGQTLRLDCAAVNTGELCAVLVLCAVSLALLHSCF